MKPSLQHIRRNIIVFSVIGLLFYLWAIANIVINGEGTLLYNPLYYYGANGIAIAVTSGVFAYFYYRYQRIPIFRIVIWSTILFFVWFFGVFIIGGNVKGNFLNVIAPSWLGLLTVMFFMGVGAINGLFGFWITLFNIAIAVYTFFIAHEYNPMIWVNILDVVGIQNAYLQWALVIASSIMGISEKGIELLDL